MSITIKNVILGDGKTKICVPIIGTSEQDIYNQAEEISGLEADMVEWRTDEDIPLEKIVGLALPLDTIRQEMQDNKVWGEKLNQLLEIAKQYGWFVVNSEDVAFTDKLDNDLKNKKHQLN